MTIPNKPTRYNLEFRGYYNASEDGDFVKYSDYEKLEKQHSALRKSMMYAINHAGGMVGDDCSDEFICMGADQVKLYVEKLKKQLEEVTRELAEWKESSRAWQEQATVYHLERDAALAQVPKFKWDFDRLKGIMIGEYKHYVDDGTDDDGNERGHEELIEWTTVKDILRDGLAAMLSLTETKKEV